MSNQAVFVDGKPIPSIDVARQSRDVIVLAGSEAGFIGSTKSHDGIGISCFIDYRLSLSIPFYSNRTGQGIAVNTFQLDLCHTRHLEVKLYTPTNGVEIQRIRDCTSHCHRRLCIISVASVSLNGGNGYSHTFIIRRHHAVCWKNTVQRIVIGEGAFDST